MLNRSVSKGESYLPLSFLFVEDAEASQELVELGFEGGAVAPGREVEYQIFFDLLPQPCWPAARLPAIIERDGAEHVAFGLDLQPSRHADFVFDPVAFDGVF